MTSSPYHPSTNGLAKRTVQTFKEGMRKQKTGSIETRVARFSYLLTAIHPSQPPAVMMFNIPLRCHLYLLKPDIGATVQNRQIQQQLNHDVQGNFRLVTQCLLRILVIVPSG